MNAPVWFETCVRNAKSSRQLGSHASFSPMELAMNGFPQLIEALTFDDVLLRPGHSEVMPSGVSIKTRLTRGIELNLPIMSSAMDTVTEARLAIAIAQA